MSKNSETFKKLFRERMRSLMLEELGTKLDSFLDEVCDTSLHLPENGKNETIKFVYETELETKVVTFIKAML